jgi:hypothetical protein
MPLTPEDREKIKETLLAPKKVATDSGTVEERSVDDIKKGLKLLDEIDAKEDKAPLMKRVGVYGRFNY